MMAIELAGVRADVEDGEWTLSPEDSLVRRMLGLLKPQAEMGPDVPDPDYEWLLEARDRFGATIVDDTRPGEGTVDVDDEVEVIY